MISDAAYIEMLKNCSKWNSRVMGGRTRSQTAVFDQQTGVMHRPTEHLFRNASERCRSQNPMQVYVYMPPRWVRSKNTPSAAIETNFFMKNNPILKEILRDPSQLSTLSNADSGSNDQSQQLNSNIHDNEADFGDYDLDEPEFNEQQSDEDDWGSNKKKRKRAVGGMPAVLGRPPKKFAAGISNSGGSTPIVLKIARTGEQVDSPGYMGSSVGGNEDKPAPPPPPVDIRPFVCQFCGAKYKSRPGLTYHRIHTHQAEMAAAKNEVPPSPSTQFNSNTTIY